MGGAVGEGLSVFVVVCRGNSPSVCLSICEEFREEVVLEDMDPEEAFVVVEGGVDVVGCTVCDDGGAESVSGCEGKEKGDRVEMRGCELGHRGCIGEFVHSFLDGFRARSEEFGYFEFGNLR